MPSTSADYSRWLKAYAEFAHAEFVLRRARLLGSPAPPSLLEKVNLLRLAAAVLAPGTGANRAGVSRKEGSRTETGRGDAMSEEKHREEWIRIQDDEKSALRKQQVTAGSSHAPVLGPGPHGDHGTNMTVEAAVSEERERCAALVESCAAGQQGEVRAAFRQLASAIRAA
jgi:hypothetical protein